MFPAPALIFRSTEIDGVFELVTTKSAFPSPSKSTIDTDVGLIPTGNSTTGAQVMLFPTVVLRKTPIVLVLILTATISGLVSLSKSPIETKDAKENGLFATSFLSKPLGAPLKFELSWLSAI